MTFDKHISKVRAEMANYHLFTTNKSFRVLSCGIPDKGFVSFLVIPACLE